jgi:lactam utilization protein B
MVMMETVRLCKKFNIKAGAHPGLPDIQGKRLLREIFLLTCSGFGRREIKMDPEEHTANIVYQVGALKAFLDREGVELHHVKPHGKLYGMMCGDYEIAKAVMLGIPKGIPVFGLAGTQMEKAANDLGLPFWAEFYGDVKYSKDGMLVIDRKKKAWKLEDVRKHVSEQLNTQTVTATDGSTVELPVKDYPISVCCHSDSPGCLDIIRTTKEVIDEFNEKHGRKDWPTQ